jgi:hypothetical protein
MKQLKIVKQPANTTPKSIPTTTTRQEIDTLAKGIAKIIEKDPKKASRIFEAWLGTPSQNSSKKRSA